MRRAPAPRVGAMLLQADAGSPAMLAGGTVNDLWWLHPDTLRWEPLASPSGGPTARAGAAWAHDPERRRLYLLGGTVGGQPSAEVWELDLPLWRWTRLDLAEPLYARSGASAAWDAAKRRVLVFGGDGLAGPSSALLAFTPDAQRWEDLSPGCTDTCPSPALGAALFLDPITRQVVAVGGESSGGYSGFWAARTSELGRTAKWRALHPPVVRVP